MARVIFEFDPLAEIKATNYCRKHAGVVKVGDEVKQWREDCNCV